MSDRNKLPDKKQNPTKTIISFLEDNKDMKDRLEKSLGKKASIDEFLSNIIMEITKNENLINCSTASILQCAIDSANFGLIPNKQLGHAWLIPSNNSVKINGSWQTKKECRLQIGYKGYVKKLAENNASVEVEVVTNLEIEQGRFQESRGSNPFIRHYPIRSGIRHQEDIACAYAIVRKKGFEDIIAVRSIEEIVESAKTEKFEKDSSGKAFKSRQLGSTWTNADRLTDFIEMVKKTMIILVSKHSNIDVVTRMSSYEGEVISNLKDISPKKRFSPEAYIDTDKVAGFLYTEEIAESNLTTNEETK